MWKQKCEKNLKKKAITLFYFSNVQDLHLSDKRGVEKYWKTLANPNNPNNLDSNNDANNNYFISLLHQFQDLLFRTTYSKTGKRVFSYYNIHYHLFGPFLTAFSFFSFFRCCFQDPGVIEKARNRKQNLRSICGCKIICGIPIQDIVTPCEGDDGRETLPDGRKFCRHCQIIIKQTTYHCSSCGTCIQEHDHHCVWTTKCVGKGNMLEFKRFILVSIGTFIYFILVIGLGPFMGWWLWDDDYEIRRVFKK